LTVDLKGPVESMYLYTYLWGPYFYYVKTEGEIRITISNPKVTWQFTTHLIGGLLIICQNTSGKRLRTP